MTSNRTIADCRRDLENFRRALDAIALREARRWFHAQCRNTCVRFHLHIHAYHMDAIVLDDFAERPSGFLAQDWRLASPAHLSSAWTERQAFLWIVEHLKRMPMAPRTTGAVQRKKGKTDGSIAEI